MNLTEFSDMLKSAAERCRPALEDELPKIAEAMKHDAQVLIGQELPAWAPLAPSTIAEKERLGYVGQISDTDPLLRTGKMRASIHVELDLPELMFAVGSMDKVALYQEMGTSRIPPRPFLAAAVLQQLKFASERLEATMMYLLDPRWNFLP